MCNNFDNPFLCGNKYYRRNYHNSILFFLFCFLQTKVSQNIFYYFHPQVKNRKIRNQIRHPLHCFADPSWLGTGHCFSLPHQRPAPLGQPPRTTSPRRSCARCRPHRHFRCVMTRRGACWYPGRAGEAAARWSRRPRFHRPIVPKKQQNHRNKQKQMRMLRTAYSSHETITWGFVTYIEFHSRFGCFQHAGGFAVHRANFGTILRAALGEILK